MNPQDKNELTVLELEEIENALSELEASGALRVLEALYKLGALRALEVNGWSGLRRKLTEQQQLAEFNRKRLDEQREQERQDAFLRARAIELGESCAAFEFDAAALGRLTPEHRGVLKRNAQIIEAHDEGLFAPGEFEKIKRLFGFWTAWYNYEKSLTAKERISTSPMLIYGD
ncbi:hypothetical protein JYB88_09985 [Shewanella cyperi]|uniref:Uncharacterized protein n=1 Tax=Shewanella cyperi TaxID=2814292 RepID=A0A975AJ19_9GAMM|nr:hypothetical protein [Shewanella cyperi]QSX28620.1 hypothetical protein JYB88_09985 [Shewanella cyperi]